MSRRSRPRQPSPQPVPAPRTRAIQASRATAALYFLITITLSFAAHAHLAAQQLTTQAPPADPTLNPPAGPLPDTPYPTAIPYRPPSTSPEISIDAETQSEQAGVYTLDGAVVITMGDRIVRADHIAYDTKTKELTATGHLEIDGGRNQEHIAASHGTFNLATQTGHFYDVSGSVGMRPAVAGHRAVYSTGNPFLFTGREVVKTGPEAYDVYDGSVTSCRLPRPDWLLSSTHFSVDDTRARAHGSTFRLLNVPILYLPYVTHPTDVEQRQTGFLVPTIGQSSTRGFYIGQQIYFAINRSTDLTVGAEYLSLRGFAQSASFRHRGLGNDFVNIHYTGLLDRRTGGTTANPGNEGGEDLVFIGRHDFSPFTRTAATVEYLSSYLYREAFSDNFNQAVTSDIVSTAYLTHHRRGTELSFYADRYQGIKVLATNTAPQQQVRIFRAPQIGFDGLEHAIGASPLRYSFLTSATGLKRTQPNFVTGGIVERFDFYPTLSLPLSTHGWMARPSIALRETLYTRSRVSPQPAGQPPMESQAGLSRTSIQFDAEVRPPVLTRTFAPTGTLARIFGAELRHTLAPEFTYRLHTGVSDFAHVLRFDSTDVVSDTNEVEYGITQRLYRRGGRTSGADSSAQPCRSGEDSSGLNPVTSVDPTGDAASAAPGFTALEQNTPGSLCTTHELISWRLAQKYFLDPHFGNAIVLNRRNIFDTTLALSGVAFLTEPREISPLLSRLRVHTSAHTDIEWDFDFDPGAKRFTSSNVFVDLHQGNTFAAASYARLDAPGRSYTQGISSTSLTTIASAVSDFNQLRLLLGWGSPIKPGLSVAANTGLDLKSIYGATRGTGANAVTVYPALLQYIAVQTAYNWNCCGVSFEYRKFQLGAVRNEPGYRFSFTLANIGTAGTLRRAERLF